LHKSLDINIRNGKILNKYNQDLNENKEIINENNGKNDEIQNNDENKDNEIKSEKINSSKNIIGIKVIVLFILKVIV
jgi:hypothetical protein